MQCLFKLCVSAMKPSKTSHSFIFKLDVLLSFSITFNSQMHYFWIPLTFSRGRFLKTRLNEKPWKQHHDNKCWSNVDSNRHMRSNWACTMLNFFICWVTKRCVYDLLVLQSKPCSTNVALNVELSTLPCLFVTPYMTQRELFILNHFAHVVLKQHYFSICCRGAASTAFRCVGLKKPRRAKKWWCFIRLNSITLFRAARFFQTNATKSPWKQHHDNKCWSNVASKPHMRSD